MQTCALDVAGLQHCVHAQLVRRRHLLMRKKLQHALMNACRGLRSRQENPNCEACRQHHAPDCA